MTARARPRSRRLASASALAALAAGLALPGAAHALAAPPAPPDATATAMPPAGEPESTTTSTTTTTTVAPDARPVVTDTHPSDAPEAPPALAAVRAVAVSGPPTVNASPTTGLNPTGTTISVTGSGFDPSANNGFGIYVVFGPVDPGTYFEDANRFLAAMWLHRGGAASGSPGQGDLRADGTFATSLPAPNGATLTATYTDGNGNGVNCLVTQCYVVTMAAHGVRDRSMDTCTPVSFAGGTATATVDRACRPVSTPAGQPTAAGTPDGSRVDGDPGGSTEAGGSGSRGARSGGASSTLPRTGAAGPGLALGGALALVAGLALVQQDRRWRAKRRRVAADGPPDCTA